jgi:hypothetical protein
MALLSHQEIDKAVYCLTGVEHLLAAANQPDRRYPTYARDVFGPSCYRWSFQEMIIPLEAAGSDLLDLQIDIEELLS